jgi:DNA invertase Pin-like site-specific DNA recombinase
MCAFHRKMCASPVVSELTPVRVHIMPEGVNAALYLRLSVDKRSDEQGVARQRADCLDLLRRRGWAAGAEFVDNDTSASGKVVRPGFVALLDAINAGRVRRVVAWNLDRIVRTTRDRLDLVDACQRHGAVVALVRGTDLDPSTPGGRLHLAILQEVAQHELDTRHDRQTRAMRQLAESGRPWTANRPFGYQRDGVTQVKAEADLLCAAYQAVAAGESMYGIARQWNEAGVPTTFGNTWSAASVRQVLVNPRYGGLRAHNGEIVGKAAWKGVVDEETWRAAERVMKAPGRRRHHPVPGRRYLLSGLALCGRCGDTMTSGLTHHGTRTYRCRRFHLSRAGEPIDRFVERTLLARLSRPDWRALLMPATEEGPDLSGEAVRLRDRLDMMATEFGADPSMTAAEYRAMRQPVVERLTELERQLASERPSLGLTGLDEAVDATEWWAGLSLDLRRAVVARSMTVTVHPAVRGRHSFDPSLIQIEWIG